MTEVPKTKTSEVDVVVIGAGPGGYAAGIRCGQAGLNTVVIDKSRLGGTCLVRGCIPSKALIHAAEQFDSISRHASGQAKLGINVDSPKINFAQTKGWKDGIVDQLTNGVAGLLKAAGARTISGTATIKDGKTIEVVSAEGDEVLRTKHLVIATGSAPVEIPGLGFGGSVLSSTEALDLTEVPDQLVVVGAGYIGLELGTAFLKLGSEVTFVEMADSILPAYDNELTAPVARYLKRKGAKFHFGAKASTFDSEQSLLRVMKADGSGTELSADRVLVTVGRKALTKGFGLENLNLKLEGDFVQVDRSCQTSVSGVYAIGDITGEPMLAHRATAQAEVVAEAIAGKRSAFDPVAIPAVVFTDPEIVVVGLSPQEALAQDPGSTAAKFPLRANGRTLSIEGNGFGFVRVVAGGDGRVLGVQIVGSHVAELQAAAVTAVEMGATVQDLVHIIQAHPSLGEAITEAALGIYSQALHI